MPAKSPLRALHGAVRRHLHIFDRLQEARAALVVKKVQTKALDAIKMHDKPCWYAPCCCASANLKALWTMFTLNTGFALGQMAGAYFAQSLSMFSDSASMLVDSLSYVVNIVAERYRLAGAPLSEKYEVCASVVSTTLLVIATSLILHQAVVRLADDEADREEVDGRLVLGFSLGNLTIDIIMCTNLFYQRCADRARGESQRLLNVNMASAFVHLFADTLRTLTGMAAGAIELDPSYNSVIVDATATIIVSSTIYMAILFVICETYSQWRRIMAHDVLETNDDLQPLDGDEARKQSSGAVTPV